MTCIIPVELQRPVNQAVLRYVEGLSAHSDVAEALSDSLKPLGDVQHFCPDPAQYRYVLASTKGNVFAVALGMALVGFRLDDRMRARWQKILIDTTKGREKVHVWGLNGMQEILIDSTAGMEKIELRDRAGQFVVMNAAAGAEHIRATDKSGSIVFMDAVAGNIIVNSSNMVFINP